MYESCERQRDAEFIAEYKADIQRALNALTVAEPQMDGEQQVADNRLALQALYTSCGGVGWTKKDGWMTEAALGDWYGVTVDVVGRVTTLNLYNNKLTGSLPSELQQLSTLTSLYLHKNQLTGPIPAELGKLADLQTLGLHDNQLSGSIPTELGLLGALTSISLNDNQLSGQIPTELGKLRAVYHIDLRNNPILKGQDALKRLLPKDTKFYF